MAEWSISTTGLLEARQRWQYASQRLGETVGRIIDKRLGEAVTYARATYLTGGTTATRLAERTGRLQASFDKEVQVTPGAQTIVTARLGYLHGPSWVGIHEYGGTIRPTNAQYLAIPLTAAARSAGSPRQYPGGLFAQTSQRGNLLLFQRTEAGIEPVYLLRSEVTIPARPALRPTVEKFTPIVTQDLKGAVRQLFQGGR